MKKNKFIEESKEHFKEWHDMNYISKAEYENRLKADMVAMLTELQTEIEEYDVIGNHSTGSYDADLYNGAYSDGMERASSIIQQKIDALKEQKVGEHDQYINQYRFNNDCNAVSVNCVYKHLLLDFIRGRSADRENKL